MLISGLFFSPSSLEFKPYKMSVFLLTMFFQNVMTLTITFASFTSGTKVHVVHTLTTKDSFDVCA